MNRGFLYGDGFFETIRVWNGTVPLIDFHLNRIYEAIETYQLEVEFTISDEFLRGICKSYNYENAIVRINFFRDGEGRYAPETNTVAFNHTAQEIDLPFFIPTALDIHSELVKAPFEEQAISYFPSPKPVHPLFTVKSLSSAYYALAGKYSVENNSKALIIENADGQICEELRSNIIIELDNQLWIPSLDAGGVFGATLRYLIANYGGEILEKPMIREDLETSTKIYLCKGSTGLIRIK